MLQTVPIRDLKDTSEIVRLCDEAQEPITVTKNGYHKLVIMSSEVFERYRQYALYDMLLKSEKEIKAGKVADAFEAQRLTREKYGL